MFNKLEVLEFLTNVVLDENYDEESDSPYDEEMIILYRDNPVKFNEEVKKRTQKYAIDNEN